MPIRRTSDDTARARRAETVVVRRSDENDNNNSRKLIIGVHTLLAGKGTEAARCTEAAAAAATVAAVRIASRGKRVHCAREESVYRSTLFSTA